jgi:RHS repeat-associated protein
MLDKGKTPYFYYNNHLGAPVKLTDKEGTVVWSATYTAFGKAEITLAKVTNNLRLPGQYFDKETGLHYNFQRYYDAETGRYITADPIGLNGGINLYAYVGGNPVSWVDPLGEWGVGITATKLLDDIIKYLFGDVRVIPNINIRWGKKCCCNGEEYRQKSVTLGLRIKFGPAAVDGGGKFNACGPCQVKPCINLSINLNITQIAFKAFLPGPVGNYLDKFGSVRAGGGGLYCLDTGFESLVFGVSARFLYIGSASTNIRIF